MMSVSLKVSIALSVALSGCDPNGPVLAGSMVTESMTALTESVTSTSISVSVPETASGELVSISDSAAESPARIWMIGESFKPSMVMVTVAVSL